MKLWNLYFIAKLFLYFAGYIGFHALENLLFAICLAVPVHRRAIAAARQVLAVPAGVALLYHDTWLPPFERVLEESSRVLGFNSAYLLEVAGRFVSWPVVAGLVGILAVFHLVGRRMPLTPAVFVAMAVPLLPIDSPFAHGDKSTSRTVSDTELTAALDNFHKQQAAQVVRYVPPPKSDAPFDIIFLQVCSLAWDDLEAIREEKNPFLKRFDVVFTRFNSGTAYSEPAMIRLHRGSCGHEKHADIFNPDDPECHTLNILQSVGWQQNVAINHDGREGDFLKELRRAADIRTKPMDLGGIAPTMYSYDDTPIWDDHAVLSKWWNQRLANPAARVAFYYNTITLHEGTRHTRKYVEDTPQAYRQRTLKLFADLDRFFAQIAASGRRAVVVFIPEHGTNLRGDRMQVAGMRELPSPTISIVPVGIKLIGQERPSAGEPQIVASPSSHLAVSTLLSRFIENSPFGKNTPSLANYLKDLPQTDFVAENNTDTLVMGYEERYFLRVKNAKWTPFHP